MVTAVREKSEGAGIGSGEQTMSSAVMVCSTRMNNESGIHMLHTTTAQREMGKRARVSKRQRQRQKRAAEDNVEHYDSL